MHTHKFREGSRSYDTENICCDATIYSSGGVTFSVYINYSIHNDDDECLNVIAIPPRTFRGMNGKYLAYEYAKNQVRILAKSIQQLIDEYGLDRIKWQKLER